MCRKCAWLQPLVNTTGQRVLHTFVAAAWNAVTTVDTELFTPGARPDAVVIRYSEVSSYHRIVNGRRLSSIKTVSFY